MDKIIERLLKLLSVKSIVTIVLTILFCILAVKGAIASDKVTVVYNIVIAFYFGTQAAKNVKTDD